MSKQKKGIRIEWTEMRPLKDAGRVLFAIIAEYTTKGWKFSGQIIGEDMHWDTLPVTPQLLDEVRNRT